VDKIGVSAPVTPIPVAYLEPIDDPIPGEVPVVGLETSI
jgi:hypothetical protein